MGLGIPETQQECLQPLRRSDGAIEFDGCHWCEDMLHGAFSIVI
jgi:hypothetical protein